MNRRTRTPPLNLTPRLPLDGVRVIDLCVVWAGPFSTLLLGDLGAEVLKAENPHVMQPMTRGTLAHPTKEYAAMIPPAAGGYPRNDPAPRAFNYNPTFVQLYRNKKSSRLICAPKKAGNLWAWSRSRPRS